MKQSNGRLFGARLLSRPAALGVGMAVAVVAGISACGGSGGDSCHNVQPAATEIGQPNFNVGNSNAGGGPTGGTLGGPQGSSSANDGTGPLFVADTVNNRILAYNTIPTGIASTTYPNGSADFVLGQPNLTSSASGTGPNSTIGTNYGLFKPSKVSMGTVNGATYLVVADTSNNRVLIWSPIPTAATAGIAPSVVIGQPDINSNASNYPAKTQTTPGSTPTASNLSGPTAAYVGGTGATAFLVVADKGNSRVLIWNGIPAKSGIPADVELGQNALSSTGVACTSNDVTTPAGFCFGTGVAGFDTVPTGGSNYTLGMNLPSDIWTDGSSLVVSDTGNHRVLVWLSNIPQQNNLLQSTYVIGFPKFGEGNQTGSSGVSGLTSPWGVSSDGSDLFVSDTGNNRVLEFPAFFNAPANGPQAKYVWGQQDFTHNTNNDPDQNGQVGDQRNNPNTNGITEGTMFSPQGVFVDDNNLIVSDSGNSRVLIYPKVAPNGNPNSYGGVDGTDVDDTNYCQ